MLKLTEHFLDYIPQHALAPLKRNGTKLENTSLSTGVFRGHAECNLGTTLVGFRKETQLIQRNSVEKQA